MAIFVTIIVALAAVVFIFGLMLQFWLFLLLFCCYSYCCVEYCRCSSSYYTVSRLALTIVVEFVPLKTKIANLSSFCIWVLLDRVITLVVCTVRFVEQFLLIMLTVNSDHMHEIIKVNHRPLVETFSLGMSRSIPKIQVSFMHCNNKSNSTYLYMV